MGLRKDALFQCSTSTRGVLGIVGGSAARVFARDFFEPAQFGAELIDVEAEHPDRFVESMADLLADSR